MSSFLRRVKQSTERKYNVALDVLFKDRLVGSVQAGTTAWHGILAATKAEKLVKQALTVRVVTSSKSKHARHLHNVTLEILFSGNLVGQVEISERGFVRAAARNKAILSLKKGLQIKAQFAQLYKGV